MLVSRCPFKDLLTRLCPPLQFICCSLSIFFISPHTTNHIRFSKFRSECNEKTLMEVFVKSIMDFPLELQIGCHCRMKQLTLLLVACIVIAYHMHTSNAQFSFSLPGKWGNGKRSFSFSLPGRWGAQGKRTSSFPWGSSDCTRMDPETIMSLYTAIQVGSLPHASHQYSI